MTAAISSSSPSPSLPPPLAASPLPVAAPSTSTSSSSSSTSPSSPSPSPLSQAESVWQSLLQRSGRRKDLLPPSTVIVLGGKGSGKSSLVHAFSDRADAAAPSTSPSYVLDYAYLAVKNRHNADKEEVLGKLNVWTVDDSSAGQLVPLLLRSAYAQPASPVLTTASTATAVQSSSASASSGSSSTSMSPDFAGYDSAVLVLCIDLSDPSRVSEQLARSSSALQAIQHAIFSRLSNEERSTLLRKISLQVQSYYNADLAASPAPDSTSDPVTGVPSADAAAPALDPHIPEVNYGVPVVLVGTKCDLLSKSPTTSAYAALTVDDRFEFVVHVLRQFALKSGSSLLLTSSAASSSSVDVLQSYAYHRLYHFPLTVTPAPLAAEGSYQLFIPSGYDSADLIATSQTHEGRWAAGMKSDEVFACEKRRQETTGKGEVRAVDDATFYKNLKFQLENNQSSPLSPHPLPSLSSATPSTSKHHSTLSTSSAAASSPTTSLPSSPSSKAKKLAAPKGQVAVKAFFKSLLQQPAAGGGQAGGVLGVDGSGSKRSSMTVRKDAELELKRMSEATQSKERGEQKER